MTGTVRTASLASLLGLITFGSTVATAWASGFALREDSAEGLGNAFAGQTAKAYDASTAYYNPAGMSQLSTSELAGSATWIAPSARFGGTNSSPFGGNVSGTTGFNGIKAAAIGSIFGVYHVNDDWALGLSVATPFGMRSEYKEDWVGRYQALASDLTDIEISPVVSYKVNSHWSVGGGPRIDYMDARLTNAINFAAVGAGANLPPAIYSTYSDGLGNVSGSDIGVGYVLSTLYRYDDSTRFGLTYRSRIFHQLSGNVSYQGTPGLLASSFPDQGAKAKITLPDSFNLGAYHDLDQRWAVMSDVSWTHWSVFKTLNVVGDNGQGLSSTNEQWQDTWFMALGANYKPADRWTLHFGTAFDQSPVENQYRTARIPDSNRYWLSTGVSYNVLPSTELNVGYAHLFADSASISETANSAAGTLSGSYSNHADIFSTSIDFKF